jgi:holo-[acyl-carrier protein] synthase
MVAGIGIDMVEVDRIAIKINMDNGFKDLVFSTGEIAYCETKTNRHEHYAARFAAKEAFFKALGTGWLKGTAFNEVEIQNAANGKPELVFLGATKTIIDGMGFTGISVSLTHIKTMASAVVIIEK